MVDRVTIIARNASGAVISCVNVSTSSGKQPLQGVMTVARNMLRIKGCVRTEIHPFASESAVYDGTPLAVMQLDELYRGISSHAPSL